MARETAPNAPLELAEFRRFKSPAGPGSLRIDISGIAVEFDGLPIELSAELARLYAPYASPVSGDGHPLRVDVRAAALDYFLPPRFAREWEVYRMLTALEDGRFHTLSYRLAGWIDVRQRMGQIALASGDLDPAPRALENFLRSTVAWLALDQNGFFLHGASIVRDGECFLFYGPSGAGKSTLAAMSDEGRVISDDLTLVLGRADGLVAAGGPFRGTYREGAPVIGTFPVAGFYRLRKDEAVRVAPDDGGCFADLLGNLPFVVDQMPAHPHLLDRIRGLVEGSRFHYLHFRRDRSFWPAIDLERAAPGSSSSVP